MKRNLLKIRKKIEKFGENSPLKMGIAYIAATFFLVILIEAAIFLIQHILTR